MRRRGLSIVVGAAVVAVVVLGGFLRLSPSVRAVPRVVEPVSHGGWQERTDLGVPKNKSRPNVRCAAALVIDNCAGEIVYARNAHVRRPIASLTKMLTALVLLESGVDLNTTVEITNEDARDSGRSRLRRGEKMALRDVLHAALMASDNRAARVLSRSTGVSYERFIARMNTRARSLGMDSTHVIEPTGLSELNISTAYDCAILINAALENRLIRHITTLREYKFRSRDRRRRTHRVVSTNRLLATRLQFVGGKTGYILESGWCMAARAQSPDHGDVTAVVLGAPTEGSRFRSLRNALRWAFALPDPARSSS